ncbi:MAG: hypothetical protein SVX43_02785, partial [Cyanobacteriota bacterium]|nr:hypothetical protein [Cyanobacteriota bacterium]
KIYESESSLVPLVKPGESVNLFVEGRLYWRDNQLNLDVRDGSGLTLRIWPLSPKENLFRFWHWREVSEMMVFNPNRNLIKGLWTGQAATNFVRITLVEN